MPRRVTDRVEDAAAWLGIAAALLLLVLAGAVGTAVHRDGLQRVADETEQRRLVSARVISEVMGETAPEVLADARPGIAPGALPEALPATVPAAARYRTALARWTAPDGTPVVGRVPLDPAPPAGRVGPVGRERAAGPGVEMAVWVDAAGRPTRPPTTPAQAAQAGVVAGVTVGLLGLTALGGGWLGLRVLVARSNDRRWEREWARVGPRWSGRVH